MPKKLLQTSEKMKRILPIFLLLSFLGFAQEKITISGTITNGKHKVPFANISAEGTSYGVAADIDGNYQLKIPSGNYTIKVQAVGFKTEIKEMNTSNYKKQPLNFDLEEDLMGLDEVVVSATRNQISRKEAPVIVNVLNAKLLKATQSISLADGLNYQPGVRVETNCQNCGLHKCV